MSTRPTPAIRHLLALCVRQEAPAELSAWLRGESAAGPEAQALVAAAERHGLAPLLYAHLKAAGVALPGNAGRTLQGLYLYHRRRSRAQTRALGEALGALATAQVPVFVIKGAALSRLVYAEPALRPMGDLDLLVSPADLPAAWQALLAAGFAEPAGGSLGAEKHFVATKILDSVQVNLELHYALLPHGREGDWAPLTASPLCFEVDGVAARTLGLEGLLWHLSRHLVGHTTVFSPLRLKWVADIVRLAEQFAGQTDWVRVERRYPLVLDVLSLLDLVCPLDAALRAELGRGRTRQRLLSENAGDRRVEWDDFHGWPRLPVAALRAEGRSGPAAVLDTLAPPAWWLRLRYGLNIHDGLVWYRWFRHPYEIAGLGVRWLREREPGPSN